MPKPNNRIHSPEDSSDMKLPKVLKKMMPVRGSDFITVTLNPSFYKYSISDQFDLTKHRIKNILKHFCKEFFLVAEITQACNVHYHGYLVYSNRHSIIRTHVIDSLKCIGLNKINEQTIENTQRVKNYMLKDYFKTRQFISEPYFFYKQKDVGSGGDFSSENNEKSLVANPSKPKYKIINLMDNTISENTITIIL